MNTAKLLLTLEQQIAILEAEVTPIGHLPTQQARFDRRLFSSHGTRLRDYMQEISHNQAQLRQEVNENRTAQVAFLAEKLVAQITALQRELATQQLRKKHREPQQGTGDLYTKLVQHQDYERRLQAMIQDRESLLGQQSLLREQQRLQQEIAALEGRLSRCRVALVRLERAIERKEKDF